MNDQRVAHEGGDAIRGLNISVDELGRFATLFVSSDIYDRAALFKTAYWFTENHYVFIRPSECGHGYEVELRHKEPTPNPDTITAVSGEFVNRLLDQQVRQVVIAETGEIRDALVKKAFFEGRKRLDPALLRTGKGTE